MLKAWEVFVFLLVISYESQAAYEGDVCNVNGKLGVCSRFSKCESAKRDLQNDRRNVKTCGYDLYEAIVCCFDEPLPKPVSNAPLATTTSPRPSTTTTEYYPETYEYVDVTNQNKPVVMNACPPVDPDLTSPKTGQKAWDKCIEYQEKLVYPCVESVGLALGSRKIRGSNCMHATDPLIIGGKDAKRHEYTHMVLLGYGDDRNNIQWLCGGSVISERFILTAGHCISNRDIGNVSYVLVGAYERDDTNDQSKVYGVKQIIKYPQYNPPSKYNDITLLELDRDIPLSKYIVPACLHTGDLVEETKVSATGWGLTQYKGNWSEKLQKVTLLKFSIEECSDKFPVNRLMRIGYDDDTQLCYGDKTQSKDTCQGDSGGPIQINSQKMKCMYVIVGVTSFGRACGFTGEPGIYTRVAPYVPWIEAIVWP